MLAADSLSRLKISLGGFWFCLSDVLRTTTRIGFTVRLKKFGKTVNFRLEHYADYSALLNIFIQDDYWLELPYTPQIIFDLGSNVGLSLLYFHLRYPKAQLFGFEPDINNYRRLKRIMREHNRIHVYNVALSSYDGRMKFFLGKRSHLSSSVFTREGNEKVVEVEAKKLDTILAELNLDCVDLLKFNIEGAELEAFRNFTRKSLVRTYIGQIHSDLFNGETKDLIGIFDDYDIEITKERGPDRCQIIARRNDQHLRYSRPDAALGISARTRDVGTTR